MRKKEKAAFVLNDGRWEDLQFILILLLLCLCPASMAEETGQYALTASGIEETVLMEQADLSGRRLAVYTPETWVHVLSTQDDWAYVQMQDGIRGYILRSSLENVNVTYRLYGIVRNPREREFLNLREEPDLNAGILGTYYNGVPCLILSHDQDGWYRVRIHGTEGYFREEFIEEKTLPYGDEIATVTPRNRNGVNMRSGPGYIYPATRLCAENSYLTVIRKGNDWWMVSDMGNLGFIHSSLLLDGVLNPVFQDEEVTGATAVVTNPKATQVLNMREKPTRFSESLAQFSNGTVFTLLQQGTQWCRVSDGKGKTGWCMTEYLTLHGAADTPTKKVIHPDESYVNLRAGPSTIASAIIDQVPHGSTVTVVIPDVEGWTMVEYEGLTGYMSTSFLH